MRKFLEDRPWLGWLVAVVAIAAAGYFAYTGLRGSTAPDSRERRAQTVTLRCTETGTEWTMNRGEFERMLMTLPQEVDASKGFPSPHAQGRPTAVLIDKEDWEQTVARINAAKKAFSGRTRTGGG
jgi:hypothetical protein